MFDIITDPRMEEVRKIIESLVSKTLLKTVRVLLTIDNKVVFIVDGTILYIINLKSVIDPYPEITFDYIEIENLEPNQTINNPYIYNTIRSIYDMYMNQISIRPIVAQNNQLRGDTQFDQVINIKASDGLRYYNMMGENMTEYKVPIFSGFPNLNKQDEIGITIYDLDEKFLIINFCIYKKKLNRDINMYFRAIKL